MRKIAIAILLRSSRNHRFVDEAGAARFLPSRHLAVSALQDAVAVACSETSIGAPQIRKAPEKKKAKRPERNRIGCCEQDLKGAEGPLVHAEISTVKAKKGSTVEHVYAEDSVGIVASKRPTSSISIVAMEKQTGLTELQVVKAENIITCENAAVENRQELASCSIASTSPSSLQDFTEIIARLDLSAYKYGDRWADAARKLLDHGIAPAYVMDMLKKCRTLPCSLLWVDSRVKDLSMLGMSHQDMGRMISRWPTILNVTDSMFQRKVEFYESIGADGDLVGKMMKSCVMTITKPLSALRKNAAFWNEYLKEVHTSTVRSMLLSDPRLLTYTSFEKKLAWLEAQDIKKKWLVKFPSMLSLSLPLLKTKAQILDQLGIVDRRKRAKVFIIVFHTQICKLQARYDNLLTLGFTHRQVQDIISRVPMVLTCTEDYVNSKVNYVHYVMNVPLDSLASSAAVWSCNLERRIKSRHEVIKRLQSLGAHGCNLSLNNMIKMKNEDFDKRFVEKLKGIVKQAEMCSA